LRLDSRSAIYCHEFLHKKFAPNSFPGLKPDDPNDVVEEFKKQGFVHEERVLKALAASISGLLVIDQSLHSSEIQRETAKALLNPDIFVIAGGYISEIAEEELAATLGKSFKPINRSSRPDLIVRMGRRSDGNPAWAPVDIKSHKAITTNQSNTVFVSDFAKLLPDVDRDQKGRLSKEDLHQLAHYTRHFQALGIECDDLWVGIIGREIGECVWSRIGDVVEGLGKKATSFLSTHDQDFAKALEIIELSQLENVDPEKKSGVISVQSSGKMGCPACMYKSTCLDEMKSFDNGNGHVTLLARVTPDIAKNYFPEIQSIRDLFNATPSNEQMVTAQIRARVWRTGVPENLDPSEKVEIPEADIEIDIDLENSMEALREADIDEPLGVDRLYLYGFGVHDRTASKDWRTATIETYFDYSNTEEGEFLVLSQMWNRLQSEIAKAENARKTIKIFHYSPHEFSWWKKFAKRYSGKPGVPTENELERFKSTYLVDLLPIARKISFPSMSYSIKDLAPLAGFEWDVDKAGGANSLLKFRTASDPDADPKARDEAITWLDSYNRDDVRATFAVREFMRRLDFPI
jgi:predicted RecB family nuclease